MIPTADDFEPFDPDDFDPEPGDDGSDDCGRWRNGKLDPQCSKAGSEECDWMRPIGLSRRTWP